jgi:hypothetical protein
MSIINGAKYLSLFAGGAMFVISCGGDNKADAQQTQQNQIIHLSAGSDAFVTYGDTVLLNAIAYSTASSISSYNWIQIGGTPVTIIDDDRSKAYIDVSDSLDNDELVFEVSVIDLQGNVASDQVTYTLNIPIIGEGCASSISGDSQHQTFTSQIHYYDSETLLPAFSYDANENTTLTFSLDEHCYSPVPLTNVRFALQSDNGLTFSNISINEENTITFDIPNVETSHSYTLTVEFDFEDGVTREHIFSGNILNIE